MLKLLKPYGDPMRERGLAEGLMEVVGLEAVQPGARAREIIDKLTEADFLMAEAGFAASEEHMSAAPKLRAVICRSIGVDCIDVEAATRRDILVLNSPQFCVTAVAEYALMLMLSLAHRLPQAIRTVKTGGWSAPEGLQGMELSGKALGLIGCGHIGRTLGRMARGIGMRVATYDPHLSTLGQDIPTLPLQQLLSTSDVVSVHAPLTPETLGMLGEKQLGWMKRGALLVNISRGGIIDEQALLDALKSGALNGAALDVLTREPPAPDHCLLRADLPQLILTPHMAWNTAEGRQRNDAAFLRQITCLAAARIPEEGVVNPAVASAWLARWSAP